MRAQRFASEPGWAVTWRMLRYAAMMLDTVDWSLIAVMAAEVQLPCHDDFSPMAVSA